MIQAEMEDHVAMERKDPNQGPESLMGFQTRAVRPDTAVGVHSNEDVKPGFLKHGLSVAMSSPQEEGRPVPPTPQFGQKSSLAGSSLSERMQARAGFKVPKLSMPFSTAAAGAENSVLGAPSSPYLTIPPGLSPASLLESPVFISNAMSQPSPTTGKLFMHGSTNDNDPIRFGGLPLPVGDGPHAFSFKPLDLKSSHYPAEAMKEQSTQVSVKTQTKTQQPAQEANLLGQLNQQNHNGRQSNPNSSGPRDPNSKLSRLASGAGAGSEHASPPADHGQTGEEGGEAREDHHPLAMAAAAPAEDGYSWRKYGQKQVKHSEYPRSYFKCTHPNCQVKKKVERSQEGHVIEIIYRGEHCHPKPALSHSQSQSRRPGGLQQPAHPFAGDGARQHQHQHQHQADAPVHQDGMDAAAALSSPSVPGELCDSSASMLIECAPMLASPEPEGADVTSPPVSDEVDGDDRATHGSMSHGGAAAADAEGDELESKRRKLESSYAIDMGTASRAAREPRVVIQTTSEVDILDDGYRWRKYGQKVVKGNPNPRSYYKCTQPGCTVRKHVERASHDLKSVITTYEGKHNHEVPAARNSGGGGGGGGHHQGTAAAAAAGARRAEHDGLMRHLGGCGLPLGLPLPPPPRDPLAPMRNYPTYAASATALGGGGGGGVGLGPASLPSLPMPAGTLGGAVEGLKIPMLAPPSSLHHQHSLLRHRQAVQAAGLVAPPKAAAGGDAAAMSVFQQMMRSELRLGHQM